MQINSVHKLAKLNLIIQFYLEITRTSSPANLFAYEEGKKELLWGRGWK